MKIGYALLFRIASGAMLGADQPVILHLLEITPALPALEGVVMELNDCAFPTLAGVVTSDDPNVAFKDVDFALLVGARPRGAGMERKDLLEANGAIFGPQGKALNDHASRDVKVLVVGNPANTNASVQQRGAAIIKARGASSAASAASAAIDHMRNWALGTDGDDWVSMAIPSDGSYGVKEGIIFGYPVTCSGGKYEIVQGLSVDDFSKEKMKATEDELREERDAVEHLFG